MAHLTRALEGCKCSRRFAPEEIITKDWARLTDADLAAIAACGCRQASCEKLHFDEHEAFSSLCFLEQHLTLQQLQAAADHLFADAACGHVLRVKGFAPDPQGTTGWLELNATAAGRTLEPIPQGQDVLIVIGEGLDKAAIEARLKAEFSTQKQQNGEKQKEKEKEVMNKTRQAPSARRIIGMVMGVIIIALGPFIQFFDGHFAQKVLKYKQEKE